MPTQAPHVDRTGGRYRPRWGAAVGWNLIVAVAYCAVGSASLLLVNETGASSPVWPAAGIGIAAIFLRGPILAPGVAVGSITSNLLVPFPTDGLEPATVRLAIALAIGPIVAAIIGGMLSRRVFGERPALSKSTEILGFLTLSALVPAIFSATLGLSVQLETGLANAATAPVVWLTWCVGDAIGTIILLPLILMFAPSQQDAWRGRRGMVALPSVVVLVGIAFAGTQNASLIVEQRESARASQARDAAEQLRAGLSANRDLLRSIVAWHASSSDVDAAAFREFTAPILAAHPEITALSWNPVVPDGERDAFTAGQRTYPGFGGYEITERTADGDLRPSATRDVYVPVAFIEPIEANRAALGFDVSSNPVRAAALERARNTGRLQASAPVTLVQDTGKNLGILYFAPAVGDEGTIDAFAVGVFQLQKLLGAVLDRPRWVDWNFVLSDTTPGSVPTTLATLGPDPEAMETTGATVLREPIDIGGRTWTLSAFPSSATIVNQPPATEPLILLGSLALAFVLEAFLLVISGHERRARRHAESSTFEATHDDMTGLLNRRGFFRNLHAVRDRIGADGSTSILLFCDLDHFKRVNDTLGHDAGDAFLRAVAQAMQGAVRERDTVARIGGDEFAVILNNCDLDQGRRVVDTMQTAVRRCTVDIDGAPWQARMSIGMTIITAETSTDVDALMRAADDACYEAKHAGRDTVRSSV